VTIPKPRKYPCRDRGTATESLAEAKTTFDRTWARAVALEESPGAVTP
jgi:hypothetical protein